VDIYDGLGVIVTYKNKWLSIIEILVYSDVKQ